MKVFQTIFLHKSQQKEDLKDFVPTSTDMPKLFVVIQNNFDFFYRELFSYHLKDIDILSSSLRT